MWKEQINKAKELYEEAKSASSTSRFYYTSNSVSRGQFSTSNDLEEDPNNAFLTADLPSSSGCRRGSSYRGSRISSIAHSHSGSVDLMEGSNFKWVSCIKSEQTFSKSYVLVSVLDNFAIRICCYHFICQNTFQHERNLPVWTFSRKRDTHSHCGNFAKTLSRRQFSVKPFSKFPSMKMVIFWYLGCL